MPNCIFFNEINSKGNIQAFQLLEETRCRWIPWMDAHELARQMPKSCKSQERGDFQAVLGHLSAAPRGSTSNMTHVTNSQGTHLWKLQVELTPSQKSLATRQTPKVKVPSAPQVPIQVTLHMLQTHQSGLLQGFLF